MVHEQQRQRPIDRRLDARCVDEHLESPRGGHERSVDAEVVARRAAEAGGVPRVVEGDLAAWHEEHARYGVAVRIESLAIAVVDRALRREPVRVTAAARERPATADRVALGRVGRRGRSADRSRGAGDDAPLAPDRAHVVLGQVAAEGVVWAEIITHQPAEPSASATSSTRRAAVTGSTAAPCAIGTSTSNSPAARSSSTRSDGSRRCSSISAARSRIRARRARAASSAGAPAARPSSIMTTTRPASPVRSEDSRAPASSAPAAARARCARRGGHGRRGRPAGRDPAGARDGARGAARRAPRSRLDPQAQAGSRPAPRCGVRRSAWRRVAAAVRAAVRLGPDACGAVEDPAWRCARGLR